MKQAARRRVAPRAAARPSRGSRAGSAVLAGGTWRHWVWGALALVASCRAPGELTAPVARVRPQQGAVVCESPLAAEVGAEVLRRGGNAADAAVACAFALAVTFPQAGNLGGGGFAVWVPGEGEPAALDFRETAPSGATPERYRGADGAPSPERLQRGALSVGVPGSPAGLWELHRRCGSGRLRFDELVAPAIALARDGFAVEAGLARDLASDASRARLALSAASRARFYPGGRALAEGERLVQPELATTLEVLARAGPRGFYSGAVAQAVVEELARAGREDGLESPRGQVTPEDLALYEPRWREPLRGWFRGREVITMPPPSSGGVILLQVLAVLDGLPLDAERRAALAAPGRAEASTAQAGGMTVRVVHWWIEALRRAFATRAESLGDPDFERVPLAELLAPAWTARTLMAIGERAGELQPLEAWREGQNTTHLSVVDGAGNALALTTTLNSTFGSGLMVPSAGFLLNNELDDFSLGLDVPNQFGLVGSNANAIRPGKRPLSSMTPTVVREGNGRVCMVLGSAGGPRIISAVLAVVLRTLVFGSTLEEAVRAPRFHQQAVPAETEFEPGWPTRTLQDLGQRGHAVRASDQRWGSLQALWIGLDGAVEACSDPRRPGAVRTAPAAPRRTGRASAR